MTVRVTTQSLESSLGWTDRVAQIGFGWFDDNDPHGLERELDPADDEDDGSDLEPDTVEDGYQPLYLVDMAGAA